VSSTTQGALPPASAVDRALVVLAFFIFVFLALRNLMDHRRHVIQDLRLALGDFFLNWIPAGAFQIQTVDIHSVKDVLAKSLGSNFGN
jgi:hypothetical protein